MKRSGYCIYELLQLLTNLKQLIFILSISCLFDFKVDMIIRKLIQVFFIPDITNNPKNADEHTESNKGIAYKIK